MGLEKQEPLPLEGPAEEKSPQVFNKERVCPMCGFDLGDNPENCFACRNEVIKRKKKSA